MQGWKKGVKMRLQNMFKKTGERENPVRKGRLRRRPEAPEGLLKKCNKCGAAILSEEVINGAYICPKCHGYFRVPAYKRIWIWMEWTVRLTRCNLKDILKR